MLALLAAKAGAKVFAIEDTPAIELARTFATTNQLDDPITLISRPSTRTSLSQPADALVTDTYDSFGLQGGLLGSAIDARRRLLREGAVLMPNAISLHVAPLSAPDAYEHLLQPWAHNLHGLDFSAGQKFAVNALQPLRIEPGQLTGPPRPIVEIDLRTATSTAVEGATELQIERPAALHGLAGWFEAQLAPGITVSNAPNSPTTPYVQAWLPAAQPLVADAGDVLRVEIETDDGASWRWRLELTDAAGSVRAASEQSTDECFPR